MVWARDGGCLARPVRSRDGLRLGLCMLRPLHAVGLWCYFLECYWIAGFEEGMEWVWGSGHRAGP